MRIAKTKRNKCVQRTANSVAQIAIGCANYKAMCTTPLAAIDAGVKSPLLV